MIVPLELGYVLVHAKRTTGSFSLFWTPWQNLTRIVGFLPLSWVAWRKCSVQLAVVTHVTIDLVFLLLLLGLFVAGAA